MQVLKGKWLLLEQRSDTPLRPVARIRKSPNAQFQLGHLPVSLGWCAPRLANRQRRAEMLTQALKPEPNSPSAAEAKRTLHSLNGGTK